MRQQASDRASAAQALQVKALLLYWSRTSEFWVTIVGVLGTLVADAGVIPKTDWDQFVAPMIVYVLARITSKVVKR